MQKKAIEIFTKIGILHFFVKVASINIENHENKLSIIASSKAVICRTNLLAFGKEEFGKLIDHDLSKNSASKLKQLSDFSVNSIFHELCHIVKEETHHQVNLETLMQDYEKTSEYYRDKLKSFLMKGGKIDIDKVYAMMDYLIMADASPSTIHQALERDKTWDDVWAAAIDMDADLCIVLLLVLGIISSYSGKGKVEKRKKYIALDYKLLYLPIVNDEVQYPEIL